MMERLFHFVKEKIPFALTGLVATGINFGVYLLLVDRYLPPGPATVIAYSSSVILNFFLQRYFVFKLNRSVQSAFALSMLVSVGGLMLDWLIVTGLHSFPYLGDQEWVIKLAATGIVFFYNFYAKRRVFEGKKGEKDQGGKGGGAAGAETFFEELRPPT
ncbi:GtrA family protein [Neolewinella persica]|uniref:GtrA family protein n=1 Tax=Neolewinella persica TaxID=70998 RepID=UPI00036A5E26|nr:GtrA family protein [Neolewinella persica]